MAVGRHAPARRFHDAVVQMRGVLFKADAGGRLCFLNPGWTVKLGHLTAASLGHSLWTFVRKSERPALRLAMARAMASRIRVEIETSFLCADGSDMLMDVCLRSGPDGGVVGSLHQIHRRVRPTSSSPGVTISTPAVQDGARPPAQWCPADLVDGVTQTAAAAAKRRGLTLDVVSESAASRAVLGDSLRVQRTLETLVRNAVRFTPRGRISVVVRATPMGETRLRLLFSVIDTGRAVGFKTRRPRFESFSGRAGQRDRLAGGFGLATARRHVEALGGSLRVESQPGGGSRLSFSVDADCASPTSITSGPLHIAPVSGRKWRDRSPVSVRPG